MSSMSLIVGTAGLAVGAGNGGKQETYVWRDAGGALVEALQEARAAGAGVLAPPSGPLFAALAALQPGERPELLPLVPNVVEYMRDSSETGLVGAALKRLRRANLGVFVRLFRLGVAHAPRILAKDFGAFLAILLELELAGFRRFRPSQIVLAAPLTDLALAAGNRAFFDSYAAYVRKRHRARPCLETQNGGHLLARLREWGIAIDSVVTALNPKGFRMKPSREVCLAEVAQATARVLAREVTAGGTVSLGEGVAFAQRSGAGGLVMELAAAEDIVLIRECRAWWGGNGSVLPSVAGPWRGTPGENDGWSHLA